MSAESYTALQTQALACAIVKSVRYYWYSGGQNSVAWLNSKGPVGNFRKQVCVTENDSPASDAHLTLAGQGGSGRASRQPKLH